MDASRWWYVFLVDGTLPRWQHHCAEAKKLTLSITDSLHISLDVSANGRIPLPPYKDDAQDRIDEVSIFLTSNIVGMNITITNALNFRSFNTNQTELEEYGHRGIHGEFDERVVMWQEPGSTVKHVDYKWPKCFVKGEQGQEGGWSYRGYQPVGAYNISIHQLGKIAGKDYYSVFKLPIIVMDDIKLFNTSSGGRIACEYVSNWWVDGKQGENMNLDEYPWKSDSDERLEVKSESGKGGKVEEYIKWPREENEEERQSRVTRDEGVGKAEASMSLAASYAAKATSTSEASCAKQSAQVVLGAAAAGLALML